MKSIRDSLKDIHLNHFPKNVGIKAIIPFWKETFIIPF